MVRTCLFLIDDALWICAEHFSSYAPSLSAVEMSECFGRSAPSVTWLRPAWVSPCLDKARSLLPPHSLRSEQVLRPRAGDQLPCQQPLGRAREAVPSRRTQLPPVNTRSSQRHQLGTLRCRDGSSRLFFCLKLLSSSHTWVPFVRLWQPCQDLAKVCRMAKNLFRHLLFFKFSVPILLEAFEIFWGRLYNLEHLFLPSLAQSQRSASVL